MKKISVGGAFEASNVVFGCMRLGHKNDKEVDTILKTALECGVDFFDHANIYHDGKSEELFGNFLAKNPDLRDNIKIQTKCCIRNGYFDFSKEHILECVDASLKRLQTDHVDSLLLHRPDTLMEPEEVAEAFDILKSCGKVLNFGVSNHNPMQIELLKTAVDEKLIANQLQLSIVECGMITSGLNANMKNSESYMHDGSILEYSRIKNMTIQAWSPFLANTPEGRKPFIGNRKYFSELNDVLDSMAEKYNLTPDGIATAWILRHPAKMQVIVGSMTSERIQRVCAGSDVDLSREDWYALYRAAGYCVP